MYKFFIVKQKLKDRLIDWSNEKKIFIFIKII